MVRPRNCLPAVRDLMQLTETAYGKILARVLPEPNDRL